MSKISVIMPVYNTIKYLPEAVDSILNQTFKDFEFIIIDDGSTDGSFELLEEYAKKDKRIRLFRNKENKGISYTRNKLINFSNTNYIASQDSDDISTPNRLQVEFDFLSKNAEYGAVSGHNYIIDEFSKNIGVRLYNQDIKKIILKKSPLSNPGSMFKKDVFLKLGGYRKDLNYGEDYDLWLNMYLNNYKLKILDEFTIYVRIREGQTKSDKLKETLKNTIELQKKYIKLGLQPSIGDRIYLFLEYILLGLPNTLILKLFKLIEYKNVR